MSFNSYLTIIILFPIICVSCSGTILVSIEEYEPETLKDYQPNEIFITDKDSIKYHFSNDTFCYIHNNVLNVKGYSSLYDSSQGGKVKTQIIKKFEGVIPLEQIKSIERIEKNKIKVITTANSEFLFENKSYYYIENDTLFGQGEIFLDIGSAYFDGNIAISDISKVKSGLQYLGKKTYKLDYLQPMEEDEINYDEYREAADAANCHTYHFEKTVVLANAGDLASVDVAIAYAETEFVATLRSYCKTATRFTWEKGFDLRYEGCEADRKTVQCVPQSV